MTRATDSRRPDAATPQPAGRTHGVAKDAAGVSLRRGVPLPFGATVHRGGINFSIFSRHATAVTLVLFRPAAAEPFAEFELDPLINKTGNVWHALICGLDPGVHYAYRMDRRPNEQPTLYRYDSSRLLLDPYARVVAGRPVWGIVSESDELAQLASAVRRAVVLEEEDFDWGHEQSHNIPLADTIIYEVHVRGFTQHPSSKVRQPGTFAGLVEKIPYLKALGITAVELLPVYEFEETDTDRINPSTGERLLNYWGYHPISFFAPKASYAADGRDGEQVREFKSMVKAFHDAGIEVILDVVFNHTAEGDERGPTYSCRGIDNKVYYIVDPADGRYHNYSGCGNTVNCNHPVVRDIILDSLRYWVTEMHVDGFRFDLASILGRGQDGSVLANPPLIERIAADPVLANTKLIAEAWDAAGLYQVGSFPAWRRWAEWNGKFRDDIRRFVRGDPGMVQTLATRLTGSPDLYQSSQREPHHSINFVTCHDGFTLADTVSYDRKHNYANGEDNRDGHNDNLSWNCGVEGFTDSPEIGRLRKRQMKNMAALVLLSHGVPMILSGDEVARSQKGNNNAYCQDNELSWMDWTLVEKNQDMLRFFQRIVHFRRRHAALRRKTYLPDDEGATVAVEWHGAHAYQPDWSSASRSLAKCIRTTMTDGTTECIYYVANAYWEEITFELPPLDGHKWHRVADTMLDSPDDIVDAGAEVCLDNQKSYRVGPRSVVLLIGK